MLKSEPPQSIGKYKIESMVGHGAMGIVYRAFDPTIERFVAIKVLHQHLLEGEEGTAFEQRFIQEAKAAARCFHPNIVTVFDFGVQATTPFIVMEYVDGIELKDQMQQGQAFSLVAALDIVIQILEALTYAHDKGVVHRDIKPANIMLMENGRIKVSDFGVARVCNSDLTSTGMMVGTPNYMSPEGLHGNVVDNRSDLYSVGILLFELLTGERPYKGLDFVEAMQPLEASKLLDTMSRAALMPILQKALQAKPELRYQDALEFLNSLIDVLSHSCNDQGTVIYQPAQVVRMSKSPELSGVGPLHSDVLSSLESSLVQYVGPAAKMLVKKYSKQAISLNELAANLAQQIPNEKERSAFVRSLEVSGLYEISMLRESESKSVIAHKNTTSTLKESNQTFVLTPEKIQMITRELAFFIGPLASRLVRQVFKKSLNLDDFYARLAKFIPGESERDVFLKKVK